MMEYIHWIIFAGLLLVGTSILAGWIRRGPVTSFAIYLAAGVLVGPHVLGWGDLDLGKATAVPLRILTEIGMVVSLFITGLKLRVPLRDAGWRTALRLALPAMLLTVAALTACVHLLLGWAWPDALALAAILAPTDPVLASLVSVDDARDDDALRVGLSGEAGLNDATALPFLLLALALMQHDATPALWTHWFLSDVVWEWVGGLAIGFSAGWLLGYAGTRLRHATRDAAPSDLMALGIMALAYGLAELTETSGFLAAFAAGVGLRRIEWRVVRLHPPEDDDGGRPPPAELLVNPNERARAEPEHPAQSVGWLVSDALSFGDTMERLIGACLVFAVGMAALMHFATDGVLVAAVLLLVVRPAAVWLCTAGARLPWKRRMLLGWFGIRGLGSLNYMAYALTHDFSNGRAAGLVDVVLTVVTLSVLLHGMTVTPLMNWRQRVIERKRARVGRAPG